MANPEHLKILKQGVKAWNKWRVERPDIIPDLSHADLHGADLRSVNLDNADLAGADLTDADLRDIRLCFVTISGATLTNANFSGASFFGGLFEEAKFTGAHFIKAKILGADLKGAKFEGADLTHARFTGADLSDAELNGTNFRGADLSYSNFSRACLDDADFTGVNSFSNVFGDIDLSRVKGLEAVRHYGPSTVGIDTIYKSGGNIPEVFLRGCGVPDEFITYMRSLVAHPIEFYSCFISYSSKDQGFAERLYADLQSKGVRCWFAPEDMKIGDKIRDRIDESIRLRDKLLLVLSENSIASQWVEHEVESALEEETRRGRTILFPIRLDDAVMESGKAWAALIRRARHVGDFTRWKDHDSYQKAFDRLLRDLKAEGAS